MARDGWTEKADGMAPRAYRRPEQQAVPEKPRKMTALEIALDAVDTRRPATTMRHDGMNQGERAMKDVVVAALKADPDGKPSEIAAAVKRREVEDKAFSDDGQYKIGMALGARIYQDRVVHMLDTAERDGHLVRDPRTPTAVEMECAMASLSDSEIPEAVRKLLVDGSPEIGIGPGALSRAIGAAMQRRRASPDASVGEDADRGVEPRPGI